jgi:hypothetical protein
MYPLQSKDKLFNLIFILYIQVLWYTFEIPIFCSVPIAVTVDIWLIHSHRW